MYMAFLFFKKNKIRSRDRSLFLLGQLKSHQNQKPHTSDMKENHALMGPFRLKELQKKI